MKMFKKTILILLALLTVSLAACGGSQVLDPSLTELSADASEPTSSLASGNNSPASDDVRRTELPLDADLDIYWARSEFVSKKHWSGYGSVFDLQSMKKDVEDATGGYIMISGLLDRNKTVWMGLDIVYWPSGFDARNVPFWTISMPYSPSCTFQCTLTINNAPKESAENDLKTLCVLECTPEFYNWSFINWTDTGGGIIDDFDYIEANEYTISAMMKVLLNVAEDPGNPDAMRGVGYEYETVIAFDMERLLT